MNLYTSGSKMNRAGKISLRVYLQMMYFLSVIGMGGSSVCVEGRGVSFGYGPPPSAFDKDNWTFNFLLLFNINWTLQVKFLLWADSYFFRGVSGQLPSLKDSPDNFYIFVAYILKILGQREGDRSRYMWSSTLYTYHLLKFHSYTFHQPKSNFYGKLNAVALFGKDESALSNQNTWYSFLPRDNPCQVCFNLVQRLEKI
jgi:hypothetical protein